MIECQVFILKENSNLHYSNVGQSSFLKAFCKRVLSVLLICTNFMGGKNIAVMFYFKFIWFLGGLALDYFHTIVDMSYFVNCYYKSQYSSNQLLSFYWFVHIRNINCHICYKIFLTTLSFVGRSSLLWEFGS